MTDRTRLAILVVLVTALPLIAGCLRMPESGPLVATSQGGPGATDVGPYIDPAPPQAGESPPDIVKHFLDAMMASSLQTSVARQFLSQDAQASWDPERSTMTYAEASQPQGSRTVDVAVSGVNRLDAGGAWLGPTELDSLSFPMVVEDGEWRIAQAPDALIVPQAWFELRFRQVSLYFFDPTAQILVPEPVYVPRGEQLASSLVRGLLAGPQTGDAQVSRTFLPPGAQLELSVPISEDGVADVTLQGDPSVLAPEAAPLALAQLSWTLRQDPDVRSFTLTIGEEPVSPPDGSATLSVDFGAEYDPTVVGSSPALFGTLDGLVAPAVASTEGGFTGPMSTTNYALSDVSVDLLAHRVAGVSATGGEVLVADLTEPTSSTQQVISQAEDLLKPVWDFQDRLWLVDRRRTGAAVSLVVEDARTSIAVPGVTGENVKSFLVSRDGSRFVAVIKDGTSDAVVVSRVVHDDEGNVVRLTQAHTIARGTPDNLLRISALGWRSPTALTLVVRVTQERDEIRFLAIDGGPNNFDALGASRRMLPERVLRLTSSPVANSDVYVTTESGVQDPFDLDRTSSVNPDIQGLTYVG